MKSFMISYDLGKPRRDYEGLITAIQQLAENWWHCLESTWIVKSTLSADAIRDRLDRYLDSSDKLLVSVVSPPAAWTGFGKDCSDWLKTNL